jgi:hypothetical protein
LTGGLARAVCAKPLQAFDTSYFTSRAVNPLGGGSIRLLICALTPDCRIPDPVR